MIKRYKFAEDYKYHFVYKTTNLINGTCYIGVHSTNNMYDTYLGSGDHISNAIKKYGKANFKREILLLFPTRNEALLNESLIVTKEFIEKDDNYNLTVGGFSPPSRKGKNVPKKGKLNLEGFILRYGNIDGPIKYQEHCKKNRQDRVQNYYKIICLETGQIFDAVRVAARYLNKHPWKIFDCIKGKLKTAYGLTWRRLDKFNNIIEPVLKQPKYNKLKVICLETKEIFNTASEATAKYSRCNIRACLRGQNITAGGLSWCYLDNNGQVIPNKCTKTPRPKKRILI